MSRSYKKMPIMGITGGSTAQKKFKQQEHRKERRAVKQSNDFELLPSPKQFGNEWASPRDGKQWLKNSPERKKWMRK